MMHLRWPALRVDAALSGQRLGLAIALSLAVHLAVLWQFSSVGTNRQRERSESIELDVTLIEPAWSPKSEEHRQRTPVPRLRQDPLPDPTPPETSMPSPGIHLDLDELFPYTWRPDTANQESFAPVTPDTERPMITGLGRITSEKLSDGHTLLRYEFNDGRVTCFWIRERNLLNEFDRGAVYAGPC